ncbi:MAG: hypothetical protein QHH19_01550 [Candidatus Thermoplasmatota archaeon]|jgi:hypothetical protein|nr:hypothetical protein [Candidatus Thermoplasmatota archaeon]
MKLIHKITLVSIIFIILVSSVYIVFFTETKQTANNNINSNNNQNNTNGNNNNNTDNNNDNQDFTHIVLVEEATATWCNNCPIVADVLHKKFNSTGKTDFYYISMVEDKNTKAHTRLYNDYNILGFPTVFIDGGYRVIMGSKDFEKNFNEKLNEAKNRQTPKILINLKAKWNETGKELTTTVTIENKETTTYRGRTRVYITEINSPWSDWNGNPYHFSFLDYAVDENIEIESGKNKTITKIWSASQNVYPENLLIVATVFNQKSTKEYSDPPEKKHEFNAYYTDATTATRVAEGSLPPVIGISSPRKGELYILGKEIGKTLKGKTLIIGKTTIKTNYQAEAGVEKVEFIIKGGFRQIRETIMEEPYEFKWSTFAFGRYTVEVKLYDKEGKTSTSNIDVVAFIL